MQSNLVAKYCKSYNNHFIKKAELKLLRLCDVSAHFSYKMHEMCKYFQNFIVFRSDVEIKARFVLLACAQFVPARLMRV